jgi:hypothetical protein
MSNAPEPCMILQGRGCQVEIQYRNVMVCASLTKIREHEHAFSEANVACLWSIATLPERDSNDHCKMDHQYQRAAGFAILLQELMKRGVCWYGVEMLLD